MLQHKLSILYIEYTVIVEGTQSVTATALTLQYIQYANLARGSHASSHAAIQPAVHGYTAIPPFHARRSREKLKAKVKIAAPAYANLVL